MNEHHKSCFCYSHPKELVIGICALCLNERLLILAAKQQDEDHDYHDDEQLHGVKTRRRGSAGGGSNNGFRHGNYKLPTKSSTIIFPKIFAILNRLEFRQRKSEEFREENGDHTDASTSLEDSFISIKFGENGKASWEKAATTTIPKASLDHCDMKWNKGIHNNNNNNNSKGEEVNNNKNTVVEHGKSRVVPLRWRKRIGHLFHLIRWKSKSRSSTNGRICHVGAKLHEGVKVRHGWIRNLTKRRTKE